MVHDMESSRKIFGKIWLWMVVRHVVEEVDVGELPVGELLGVHLNLELDII